MIPTILNEDSVKIGNCNNNTIGPMSVTIVSSDSTTTTNNKPAIATATSPLKYIFKKGTDMKLHFGFLKKRHTEGSINKTSSGSTSVRPCPEEAAKWSNSFHDLINSKYGQALFKAFLQREFCEENLEFWLAIEDYHKASQSKLSNKAQKIYNEFILPQSPKEINLDAITRDSLITKMLQPPCHTTFDQAQKRTQGVLEADAYQRFLKSDLYLELIYPERYAESS